ncbi:cytochrome P450 [Chachezhania antarctica]|uniref:cytochrome P450 n=1 Tax=Chachezhania antarctica TaxID=2340860 RepID=UPI000EB17006|nr:cytochrome P450 [Chachezhania antarctica]
MPKVSQSPVDPGFVQNPYPFYDRARATGQLVHWSDYKMPAATTHAAVQAILRDRRFGREVPAELATAPPPHLAPFYAVEDHSMLDAEPPRHTRLRGLVNRAFTSRRIASLSPWIEVLCHDLIDGFPAEPFDLIPACCARVPVLTIARLLGVPADMAPQLLRWSHDMVAMYQSTRTRAVEDRAAEAATDFATYIASYADTRRTAPADDLITDLLKAEAEGDRLSTPELVTTCILLLNAGHEATVHALGNGIKALIETGTGTACTTPEGAEQAAEEILRHDPPLHVFTRYAYEEIDLHGHRFQRGDQVALLLGAAGRDPDVWEQPHDFDPTRPPKPHAAFGAGLHFCLGAPLARLEMRLALQVLFTRCPNLRLAEPPVYGDTYHFHGLTRLQVTA